MMKGHCGMVFRSGMSEAHFWRCVCVFVPPLSLLDLNFTAPEPHPSNRKTETTRANLPSLARTILHPTPLFTFPVSCCVCLAAASDCSPIWAPRFFSEPESPKCNVLVKMDWWKWHVVVCLQECSFSLRQHINYHDGKSWWWFYCICRIFEL